MQAALDNNAVVEPQHERKSDSTENRLQPAPLVASNGNNSGQDGEPPEARRARSIWRNRDFLLLWSGQNISILGGKMSELAYPLIILAMTHSPAKAGLAPMFWLLPFILFGLPAGALVDRWNRKKVMLICDSVRMVAIAMLPAAYLLGHLNVALVYAAALTEGFGFCFFNLAETAAISQVVDKEHLPQAMAVNEMGYSATNTVGPGIAGAIMATMRTTIAGAVLAFAVDSASYLASLGSLLLMRTPFQQERAVREEPASIWSDVREGLTFLWRHERIRLVAFWAGSLALIFGGFNLTVIMIVRSVLHLGAGTIGLLFSIGGIGGMIGAAVAPKVKERVRFGALLLSVVTVQSLGTIVQAIAPSLIVMAVMQFICTAANPLWNVTQMSYRLSIIPDHLQGRVNACFRLLIFASFPLGSIIAGTLLEHADPRLVLGAMGIGGLLTVAVVSATSLRKA